MPYEFKLIDTIPATPQEIYEAWLDSLAHSAMTGATAVMSDKVGAAVSAWDGYITGRNVELVPGERIVQSWRTSKFTDAHEDSVVTVLLEETDDGTLLTLVHSNVPDDQRSYEEGGWEESYFLPMKEYFSEKAKTGTKKSPAKHAAKKPAAKKAAAKKATGKKATSRAKAAKKASAKKTKKTSGKRRASATKRSSRKRRR